MNNRIRFVRNNSGLSQDDFARRINLSKNFVSLIETGGRTPSDRTISDICREFDVSEEWLRTGTGEPFKPLTRGEEIGQIVAAASRHEPAEAVEFFTNLLHDMSDAEIVLMYEIYRRHFEK